MNKETIATAITGKWYRYLPVSINKNPELSLQENEWYQVKVESDTIKILNHHSKSACCHLECPETLCGSILDLDNPEDFHPAGHQPRQNPYEIYLQEQKKSALARRDHCVGIAGKHIPGSVTNQIFTSLASEHLDTAKLFESAIGVYKEMHN